MSEDLDELLKTDARQASDSLAKEVTNKWTQAQETADQAENNAVSINKMLSDNVSAGDGVGRIHNIIRGLASTLVTGCGRKEISFMDRLLL